MAKWSIVLLCILTAQTVCTTNTTGDKTEYDDGNPTTLRPHSNADSTNPNEEEMTSEDDGDVIAGYTLPAEHETAETVQPEGADDVPADYEYVNGWIIGQPVFKTRTEDGATKVDDTGNRATEKDDTGDRATEKEDTGDRATVFGDVATRVPPPTAFTEMTLAEFGDFDELVPVNEAAVNGDWQRALFRVGGDRLNHRPHEETASDGAHGEKVVPVDVLPWFPEVTYHVTEVTPRWRKEYTGNPTITPELDVNYTDVDL